MGHLHKYKYEQNNRN